MLLDWRTAREAWNYFGLNLEVNDDEVRLNLGNVPIRIKPDEEAEMVWCERIDPARTFIYNIPLAISGHRFGDMVLNDGAPVGYRQGNDGQEIPVFNQLQLLKKSAYSTYSATVYTFKQVDINKLQELCVNAKVEFEDWSTIRFLCKQCSEGMSHKIHDHELRLDNNSERLIAFASTSEDAVIQVLKNWRAITLCEHSQLSLELELVDLRALKDKLISSVN